MRAVRKIGNTLYNLILLAFSISCIFPIIWVMYSSPENKGRIYAGYCVTAKASTVSELL